jgi:hypothetical protein
MIDGIGRLAQLIHQRVSTGKTAANQTGGAAKDKPIPLTAQSAEPASFTQLLTRVQQLDPQDPQRERKAFRYFLEAALLTELGTEILADPKFARLVDTVQQRMETQSELLADMRRTATLLLSMAPTRPPE